MNRSKLKESGAQRTASRAAAYTTARPKLPCLLLLAAGLLLLGLWVWREPIELHFLRTAKFDAVESFVDRHPDSTAGLALFTERCLNEGRPQVAVSRLLARIQANPAHPELRVLAARALMATGDDTPAYAHLRIATNLEPGNVVAQRELAEVLIRADRKEEADMILREILQQDPKDLETLIRIGRFADREGRFSEAEGFFRRALHLDGESGDALAGLAEVLVRLGKPAEAAPLARKAVRRLPRSAYPHLWLARALQAVDPQHHAAEIEAAFQRALQLSKEPAIPRLFYAQFLRDQKRLPEAIQNLQSNIRANPLDKLSWYELSLAYRVQGDTTQAKAATDRFRKLNALDLESSELEYRVWAEPDNVALRLELARFYLKHHRPDLARPQVAHVLNRNPNLSAARELAATVDRRLQRAPSP